MLIKYLKSLDFVIVKAKRDTTLEQSNKIKPPKEDSFIKFLEALPSVKYTIQELNESILKMRKEI
jgi:hypothetical protein